MISLNATIIVQVALFLALVFILNRIMIKPLHKVIMDRETELEEKKEALALARGKVKELAAQYDTKLASAEDQARRAYYELSLATKAEAREMTSRAIEQLVAIRQKVHAEVAEELEKARKELQERAEAVSYEVTEKIIGRRI